MKKNKQENPIIELITFVIVAVLLVCSFLTIMASVILLF